MTHRRDRGGRSRSGSREGSGVASLLSPFLFKILDFLKSYCYYFWAFLFYFLFFVSGYFCCLFYVFCSFFSFLYFSSFPLFFIDLSLSLFFSRFPTLSICLSFLVSLLSSFSLTVISENRFLCGIVKGKNNEKKKKKEKNVSYIANYHSLCWS